MKQFTDITVLLDRSGSMGTIKGAMEEAFDAFVQKHKEIPSTKLTLVQFDNISPYEVIYQCVPVKGVERLRLHPRGSTPLLDAMCLTIDATGSRLASMDESERPDQVLIVIITDGEENSSNRFNRQDVFNRITKQTNDYKWNFVYLGANQDAIKEAASLGIHWDHAITYTATKGGTRNMAGSLSANTFAYAAQEGFARMDNVQAFTAEQRKDALDVSNQTVSTTTTK